MRRSVRFLMIMVFALLQCTSPLVHAHVGGGNAGDHAHISEVQQRLHHAAMLANGHAGAEALGLPVIDMPQGKKRNVSESEPEPVFEPVFLSSLVHGLYVPQFLRVPRTITFPPADERPSSPSLFRKQHPQAPPILAL